MRLTALLLVAACGSHGSGGGSDGSAGDDSGGTGDAAIDVPNVQGTVHVHVTNTAAGMCMPGLHAIFIDTDGTATDTTTDSNGDASHDVFPGASVTVICSRTTGSFTTVTIQAIEPGDSLVLDAGAFLTGTGAASQVDVGAFKVSYPAYAGAAGYTIYSPCGATQVSGTSNQMINMQQGCVQATMDLVVTANNGMGAAVAFVSTTSVPFTGNGSTTITDTWHPVATITASYTNAPAFCADATNMNYPCNVDLTRYVPDVRGQAARGTTNIATTATTMVTSPAPAHAWMRTLLTTGGAVQQDITQVVDGTQTSYAVDLAAMQLPWMCLDATSNCPVWTKTDPKSIDVPVTGTGTFDLYEVDATYVRTTTQGTIILVWRAFGPTAGNFVFPDLPASAPPVKPIVGDTKSATHALICESDALAGYRPARQDVFGSLATCVSSPAQTAVKPAPASTLNRLSRVN